MDQENLGIKTIEKIMATGISDWIRWGRNKDYLPVSFRCPLGFLYIQKRGDIAARLEKPAPINLLAVVEFERLVIALPEKHRQAFVMYHLDRAIVRGRVSDKKRSGYEYAKLLNVHRSYYYVLLTQAHNMIFRRWKHLQECDKQKIFEEQ